MDISLTELIALIAVVHCFGLSLIILLSKFFKNEDNKYLGYALLIISIVGLNNWFWDLNRSPIITSVLDLMLWQFLYPVTYFMFFYESSSKSSSKSAWTDFLYLPFLILSAVNVVVSLDKVFHLYSLNEAVSGYSQFFYRGISLLSLVFSLILIILSYKYVFKSNSSSRKWLRYVWFFFSLILLYGMALEAYRFLYLRRLPLTYLWSVGGILMYWLIYKGLYQFKLSNDQYEIRSILQETKKKPSEREGTRSAHYQNLIDLLENEKIHRDPNLDRDSLAERLGISSGYLSQIIKQNTSHNFSKLITSYRVKDAKAMIRNPLFDKYDLLSIGLECGFNSKTSFFVNFKRDTSLTPKQYRNQEVLFS